MKREYSLKKNKEFNYVFRRGKSFANKAFVVYVARGYGAEFKIGFSISKKIGSAVKRNKLKRQMKECIRAYLPQLKKGIKIIIISRIASASMDYQQICGSLTHLFKKSGLIEHSNE